MVDTDTAAARNKELVLNGFQRFAAGDIDVLDSLLHEDFIEHSPGNPSGKQAFIDFIAQAPVARSRLELARVIADDTYVVMHYRMTDREDNRSDAVVDIWRLDQGQIVEHWDVVQPIPDPAQTPHGMM